MFIVIAFIRISLSDTSFLFLNINYANTDTILYDIHICIFNPKTALRNKVLALIRVIEYVWQLKNWPILIRLQPVICNGYSIYWTINPPICMERNKIIKQSLYYIILKVCTLFLLYVLNNMIFNMMFVTYNKSILDPYYIYNLWMPLTKVQQLLVWPKRKNVLWVHTSNIIILFFYLHLKILI